MARKKQRPTAVIVSERGNIYVDGARFDADFRYPYWIIKFNQRLLFPGFRRDHKKIIYINGKRYGKADWREGCIPLEPYRIREEYFSDKVTNFVRETFGLKCSRNSRGYFNIKLKATTYIVVVRVTQEGYTRCLVYIRGSEEYVGDFLFDQKIETVYPRLVMRNLERTFCVIIGYVMDSLVYATVASQLNRKLELRF